MNVHFTSSFFFILTEQALFGEDEWYFFTPRDRKYPNGLRPNRAASSGYWKATGTDKPILTSCLTKSIGVKKALVFYKGRPPKGVKTDWIMHEYRLHDNMIRIAKRKGSMRVSWLNQPLMNILIFFFLTMVIKKEVNGLFFSLLQRFNVIVTIFFEIFCTVGRLGAMSGSGKMWRTKEHEGR